MPKYIRTKDEILKALDTDYMCGVKVYHTEKGMITEKLVLKQADTIEELCDGFYLDDLLLGRFNASGTYDSGLFMFNKAKDLYYAYNKGRIPVELYGFIKTSKGLIYVAKMDSEGKLVLI